MKKGQDCIGVSVVFACHDGEGSYVFLKRSTNCRDEHGTWDPGAGAIEFGDTVEESLRKEVLEEYCAEVLSFERLGYREVHREHDGVKTHWIALDFKVLVNRDTVQIGEPHKADALDWFKMDALPTPMHSQWPIFFELYKHKLLAE